MYIYEYLCWIRATFFPQETELMKLTVPPSSANMVVLSLRTNFKEPLKVEVILVSYLIIAAVPSGKASRARTLSPIKKFKIIFN